MPINDDFDDAEEAAEEWSWDPDEDTKDSHDAGTVRGTFIDAVDLSAAEENYTPIVPTTVPDDEKIGQKVYFQKPRPGTELEVHTRLPTQSRRRFWQYRHELYAQMAYILVRFGRTEIGQAWLTNQRWCFHTIHFSDNTPPPLTAMERRYLSRREARHRQERIGVLTPSEQNTLFAWQEDLTRCALRLLGDSPAHMIRMASLLLQGDHTDTDAALFTNAIAKAEIFCPAEDKQGIGFDWAADALREYSL